MKDGDHHWVKLGWSRKSMEKMDGGKTVVSTIRTWNRTAQGLDTPHRVSGGSSEGSWGGKISDLCERKLSLTLHISMIAAPSLPRRGPKPLASSWTPLSPYIPQSGNPGGIRLQNDRNLATSDVLLCYHLHQRHLISHQDSCFLTDLPILLLTPLLRVSTWQS